VIDRNRFPSFGVEGIGADENHWLSFGSLLGTLLQFLKERLLASRISLST